MRTIIDTYTGTRCNIPMAIHVSDCRERKREIGEEKSEGWNKKADSKQIGSERSVDVTSWKLPQSTVMCFRV